MKRMIHFEVYQGVFQKILIKKKDYSEDFL